MVMAILLAPAPLPAQQKSAIELTSLAEVEKVEKNAQGDKEARRQDAATAKVVPGDVVVFTTRYVNTSDKPVSNVTIMNPVPEHMTYLDKSAEGKGARIDYSVDSGKTYADADRLTVKDSTGKTRTAAAQDYTHIRWVLTAPLAPGGAGSVSFKAQLK
jgi:uncharacterized repeat protein (TIGR01451 family)